MSNPNCGDQISARLAKPNKLAGVMDMLNTINYEQAGTFLSGLQEGALTKPYTLPSSTSSNDELSRCCLTKQGNETEILKQTLPRFSGRYVSRMISASTFDISKRFVTPVFGHGGTRADLENFIRKLSNHKRLKNLLLVITPSSSKLADMWKLHCFAVDNQMHLGVTRLSSDERALIEKHHNQNNYHLMMCSQSIDLEDVSRATPIKKQIIESLQPECPPLRTVCYKDQLVVLNYILLEQAGTEPKIKSLQAPKIPVRYRRTHGIDRSDRLALIQQQCYSCSVLYSRHKRERVSSPSQPSRTAPKPILKSAQLNEQKVLEKQNDMIPNEPRKEELECTVRDLLKQMNLKTPSISPDRRKCVVESPLARPQAKSKTVRPEHLESTVMDLRKQMNLRSPSISPHRRKCVVESPLARPQAKSKTVSPEQLESTVMDLRKQMNLRSPSISPHRRKCVVESPLARPQAKSKTVSPEQLESTVMDLRKQINLRSPSISPDRRKCVVELPLAGPQAKSKAVSPEQEQLIKKCINLGYTTIIENIKVKLGNINLIDTEWEAQVESKPKKQNASSITNEEKQKIESPIDNKEKDLKLNHPMDDIKNEIRENSKKKRVEAMERSDEMERIANEPKCKQSENQRNDFTKSKNGKPALESMLEHMKQKAKRAQLAKIAKEKEEQTGEKQETDGNHLQAEQAALVSAQAASTETIASQTQTCKLRSLDDVIKMESAITIKQTEPSSESKNLKIPQGKSVSKLVESQPLKHDVPNKPVQQKQIEIRTTRMPSQQNVEVAELKENMSTVAKPALEGMLAYKKEKSKEAQLAKISKEKGQTGQKQESEEKLLLAEQVDLASFQAASTEASQTQTCKLRSLDDIIKMESGTITKQTESSSESMNLKNSQGKSVSKLVASQSLKHDVPKEPLQAKQVEIRSPRIPNKQLVEVGDIEENMSIVVQQKMLVSKTPKDCMTSRSRVTFRSWKKQLVRLKKPGLESMLTYKKQISKEAPLAKISKEKGQTEQKQDTEERLLLAEQVQLPSAQAASQTQICKLGSENDKVTMKSAENMNVGSVSIATASQFLKHDVPNEPLQAKPVEIRSLPITNKQHLDAGDMKENVSTMVHQKKLVSKTPKDCVTSKSNVQKEAQLAKISKEKVQIGQKQEPEGEAQLAKISKKIGQIGQKLESEQKSLPAEQVEVASVQAASQTHICKLSFENNILKMETAGNVNFQDSQGTSKQVKIRSPRISNKQKVKAADIKESKSTMTQKKNLLSKRPKDCITRKARVPLKSWKEKSVCCCKASSEKITSSWQSMPASAKRKREIEKQRHRHALNVLLAEPLSARDKHLQKQRAVYQAYKEKARQDREQAKLYQELASRRQFQRFLLQISSVEPSSQCSAQVSEPVSPKKPRLAKPQFNTCIRPLKELESLSSDTGKEFKIPQNLCNLTETLRRLGHFEHLLKDHPPMENKSTQVGRASGDACCVKFDEPFNLQADSNGIKYLWGPQELHKSQGRIKSQCYFMSLGRKQRSVYQNHCSIINQSSTSFERIMSPVEVPSEYSLQARLLLRQKLRPLNLKLAFEKYGVLIDCINRRPVPLDEHLMVFFQLAELLDLKLYVREEVYFPGYAPISQPKYRLECYIFDDRKDFFGSIALLATQLEQAIQQFPHLLHNLRHIEDAFYLTDLPQSLTSGLRHLFKFFRARGLFSLLAELTYDWMQPRTTVLGLRQNQSQALEALICQKARDTRHKHLKED